MMLGICSFITWIVIIIFSLMPKKLSGIELAILFILDTIFEASVFALLSVNFSVVEVSHKVEPSFVDIIVRMFLLPFAMMIAANVWLYSWKRLKWMLEAVILAALTLTYPILKLVGVFKAYRWGWTYTVGLIACYLLFSCLIAWLIRKSGPKEVAAR